MQNELFQEKHLTAEELMAGVDNIKASPKQSGVVEMIVARPGVGTRKILDVGQLDTEQGLMGDNWLKRGYRKSSDGSAHPDMQVNIMNSRAAQLIAVTRQRWPLAGDQFFVDFDLSPTNIPPGTRLNIGGAIIEVTSEPHLGCQKFSERFGKNAALFVNLDLGKALNLRGINAKVIQAGEVKTGDMICKAT